MSMNKFNINKSIFEYFRWVKSTRNRGSCRLVVFTEYGHIISFFYFTY